MNFNKTASKLIFSLLMTINTLNAQKAPFGLCNAEKTRLNLGEPGKKNSPEQIAQYAFQSVTREFIPKFALDSYIKDQIKENDFVDWVNLLACVYELVMQKKDINQNYKNYALQFYPISLLAYTTAKTLYSKRELSSSELDALKKTLISKIEALKVMTVISLRTIENSMAPSSEWKKKANKDLEVLFPNYKNFFKDYVFVKDFKNEPITNNQFDAFLKINGINTTSRYSIEDVLNNLELLTYRLEQSWSLFQSSSQKAATAALIRDSKEIADRIKNQYANLKIVPDLSKDKIGRTKDNASLIVFAIADQLYGVLLKLLKEVNTLTPKK